MRKLCRKLAGLLLAVLVCSLLPTAQAAAPDNRFVLVAEAGGRLVIAPEYVSYETGLNIGQALSAADHTFDGLADGQVYAIDGVVGSFTRSDQTGSYDLAKPASEVTHYRFSENIGTSQPSEGLMQLMTAMADYLLEDADVQKAAKAAYDTACAGFVGITSEAASACAGDLTKAVAAYKASIAGSTFRVGFSGFTEAAYPGISITAENLHGKIWSDDGDGVLTLPTGTYTFRISWDGLHVEGRLTVDGSDLTVHAEFPSGTWLETDSFALSASYGKGDEEKVGFDENVFPSGAWNGRELTVPVKDTFVGTVYTYAVYDKTMSMTAIYTNTDGEQMAEALACGSKVTGATSVLARGGQGNDVIYRISAADSNGYILSQDYTVHFTRIPTLTGIAVTDQNGRAQAATEQFADDKTEYVYKVLDTVKSLKLKPVGLDSGYTILVNGQNAADGAEVTVGGEMAVTVEVLCGTYSNTYTLHIQPGEGKSASFLSTADQFRVVNSEGVELPFDKELENNGVWRYKYTLVPGETYYYEATKDQYYHAKDTFTLEDQSIIEVSVPTEDWLTALALGDGEQKGKRGNLALDAAFSSAVHGYGTELLDTNASVYLWAECVDGVQISALYDQIHYSDTYHGKQQNLVIASGLEKGIRLQRALLAENPYGNTVTVRLSKEDGGITYYQDYEINLERTLSLQNLQAFCGSDTVPLGKTGYDPAVKTYTVTVPMAADTLTLQAEPYDDGSTNVCYGEEDNGYVVLVNGIEAAGTATVELSGTLETETIKITVSSSKTDAKAAVYTIQVQKAAPTVVSLNLTPADVLLCVHESASGNRVWLDGTTLNLSEGFTYEYTLTRNGYVGQKGTLLVTRDETKNLILQHNDQVLNASSGQVTLALSLEQAPANTAIKPEIEAQWADFRGNSHNNGVTDVEIPITAETGTLYWANKLGDGIDADAVGCPILVDGDLITYSGDTLYRVDTVSGEILTTGQMDHKSSFSITPPTYYEGMLFMALSDGTVQAFNADTLESLWIYKDPLGGQPNSPITVCDGYLYTGFWYSETGDANFVCLSVTDEDPSQSKEEKPVTWYYTKQGGYYWAGAYVTEDWLLVGTDDGYGGCTHKTSQLLLLDTKTGRLLDSWDNLNSDIRSTVVYDDQTQACYFTAKGGTFYSVKVADQKLTDKWSVALDNGSTATPMSTSTPVVYNGRAYIGVSGTGQFSAYSGHNITVIDLNRKAVAYKMETQGYPQTSGLLTTAYEEENGYAYIYFFDNYTPGKLRVLRDKAGQTAPDYVTAESGKHAPYALFTPVGDQAQYAICSPIVDEYGTVYFKNDSAHLMAFGSAITKLEVTTQPDKTEYAPGEPFDPSGMVVTATYANGKTRDVTKYVTASELMEGDTTVTLTFPYVMYHNQENGTAMDAGVTTPAPYVDIKITVQNQNLTPGVHVTGDKVQIVFEENQIVEDGWFVYAVSYSDTGKMLNIAAAVQKGTVMEAQLSGAADADEVRVFVMKGDHTPAWARLSTLDQKEGT